MRSVFGNFSLSVCVGLASLLSHMASAATFTPTTVGQLIAAINTANGNAASDTIDLGGLVFTLTSVNNTNANNGPNGLPVVAADGGNALRIFNGTLERSVAAPDFRLLEVAPGANLTLDRVVISNGSGAALFNRGVVAIVDSTFSNNTGVLGGALHNVSSGTITAISGSTFSANTVTGTGGAIYNLGSIESIANSTFSGNGADTSGGAIGNAKTITAIVNCTFAGNVSLSGGAIYNPGAATIAILGSNIIALNSAETGPAIFTSSAIGAESFNMIDDNSESLLVAGTPNPNNSYVGTAARIIDPFIGPLANNGGPTQTHALQDVSLAKGTGANPNALAFDQRGAPFPRTFGGKTDIGAFESQTPASLDIDATVTTTQYDALTDGLLAIRHMFGLTATALTNGALGGAAARTDPAAIKAYMDVNSATFDIDGDGNADALTDGLLIIRYLFGLRGAALINGAIAPLATRTTAPAIEAYLATLTP